VWADDSRWTPADDLPERALADTYTARVVVAAVEVEIDPARAFTGFTDPAIYSRWLGVPVTIAAGRFACTMEWGTRVRGWYDVVHPPRLIALRWDFEDDNVPVPGGEMTGYLQVHARDDGGSRVEVHQLVDTATHADYMEVAWTMVLGRFKAGIESALSPTAPVERRATRPKRRRP